MGHSVGRRPFYSRGFIPSVLMHYFYFGYFGPA
jgi:hypothetical protein